MKFKSISTTDFWRALLISLALHGLFLWQAPPSPPNGMLQPLPSFQASALRASLNTDTRQQPLAAASAAVPMGGASAVQQPSKPPWPRHRPELPSPPQPALMSAFGRSGEQGPDANGVRQYRLSLAVAARRFKLYPPLAMEKGWSGTTEVRLAIAASGVQQPVQLLRTSGHSELDAAALEMIGNAALATVVPASLRGQDFSIALPVMFELNGQEQNYLAGSGSDWAP